MFDAHFKRAFIGLFSRLGTRVWPNDFPLGLVTLRLRSHPVSSRAACASRWRQVAVTACKTAIVFAGSAVRTCVVRSPGGGRLRVGICVAESGRTFGEGVRFFLPRRSRRHATHKLSALIAWCVTYRGRNYDIYAACMSCMSRKLSALITYMYMYTMLYNTCKPRLYAVCKHGLHNYRCKITLKRAFLQSKPCSVSTSVWCCVCAPLALREKERER